MEDSIKKNAMIKHGEKITYGCLRGYTMSGSKTQECDNGHWTIDAPVCKGQLIKSISVILFLELNAYLMSTICEHSHYS